MNVKITIGKIFPPHVSEDEYVEIQSSMVKIPQPQGEPSKSSFFPPAKTTMVVATIDA